MGIWEIVIILLAIAFVAFIIWLITYLVNKSKK